MDKVLEFLKKHKKKLIVLAIILVFIILIFWSFKKIINFLSPSSKQSVYGDRCENVKNYPVTKDIKNNIKQTIETYPNIVVLNIDVKCKLIDITINLNADTEDAVINEMSLALLNVLDENIKNNYDIELLITSSNSEDLTYPRIGTHHKVIKGEANDNFVW